MRNRFGLHRPRGRAGSSFVLRLSSFVGRGRRAAVVAALLGLGLLAALPLLAHSGFLLTRGGGDSPFLLLRLHQLLAALAGGQFPARWMPDAALGYGYPFFSYYASFPYYLAAALHAYGFSFVAALKLTQTAALMAGAAGMYAWARRLPSGGAPGGLGRAGAWLAAAAYTFAPYHLANLYVRGDSLSELWALGLFPWVFAAAQACLDRPGVRRALALALATGLLVLTHNISALIFMPFVLIYILVTMTSGLARGHRGARGGRGVPAAAGFTPAGPNSAISPWRSQMASGLLCGLALAGGLALSAFFWLPALGEIGAVQPADLTAGYFFYGNHFRGADLIQSTLFYNAEAAPGLPSPFSMGLAQALLGGWGVAALVWRAYKARRWTSGDTLVLAGLALSTYMMTPASAWAWERLPLLRFAQFPWRFLAIQALFTAAATGFLVPAARGSQGHLAHTKVRSRLPRGTGVQGPASGARGHASTASNQGPRRNNLEVYVPTTVAVVLGAGLALFGLGGLRPEFIPLADADVTAERLQVMEYFTGNLGSTIGYEYLPGGVSLRPFASDELLGRAPALKTLTGEAEGQRVWQRGAAEGWTITATDGPARVAVPSYYWPGWRVRVDGQAVEASAADGLGWISFEVGPGTHSVELRLGGTPLRTASEAVSVAALVVAAGLWMWRVPHRGARGERGVGGGRQRGAAGRRRYGWLVAAVGVAAGAVILRLWPAPVENKLPVSMDFAQLAVPHRDEVLFADGARLTAIAFSETRVERGAFLSITSTWAGAAGDSVTMALAPGSNLVSQAVEVLAAATVTLGETEPAEAEHTLRVPVDIPPGVYFITAQVMGTDGAPLAAVTRGGRERGLVHLGPIWVDDDIPTAAGPALATFGEGVALIAAGGVGSEVGVVETHLWWEVKASLAANYLLGLRLRDAAGFEWAGSDSQLAYGFYPTFMWRAGEVVPDFYRLSTPVGTPPGEYTMELYVYEPVTGAARGETLRYPLLVLAHTPRGDRVAQQTLTPEMELGTVTMPARFNQGEAPEVEVEWLTTGTPVADYRAEWSLVAPDGARVTQVLDLAAGARTSQWPADAYLVGRARLGTESTLTPGRYAVTLALVDENGRAASAEVAVGEVEVMGRPRSYSVPPLEHPVGATFGAALTLHGFDMDEDGTTLRLSLVWGARAAPGRDYKFFVHLFNEADGFVVQQVDSVPHDFTYPTVLWTAGEVVTDTASFDWAGLPPGSYGIAVGWYDPNTENLDRLPAYDIEGQPLAGDRVVLLEGLERP